MDANQGKIILIRGRGSKETVDENISGLFGGGAAKSARAHPITEVGSNLSYIGMIYSAKGRNLYYIGIMANAVGPVAIFRRIL